jgi:hypothetical protein
MSVSVTSLLLSLVGERRTERKINMTIETYTISKV